MFHIFGGMNSVYLMLGGNSGDRRWNLGKARELIARSVGRIVKASAIYETAAWGNEEQPGFYNQAIRVETACNAQEVLQKILDIEREMGRTRTEIRWQMRSIDIDILYFNDEIIDGGSLTVPHPHIRDRRFVLVPLAEIAPGLIDPRTKTTVLDLLNECRDTLTVKVLME